jgi:hypothetical protein
MDGWLEIIKEKTEQINTPLRIYPIMVAAMPMESRTLHRYQHHRHRHP